MQSTTMTSDAMLSPQTPEGTTHAPNVLEHHSDPYLSKASKDSSRLSAASQQSHTSLQSSTHDETCGLQCTPIGVDDTSSAILALSGTAVPEGDDEQAHREKIARMFEDQDVFGSATEPHWQSSHQIVDMLYALKTVPRIGLDGKADEATADTIVQTVEYGFPLMMWLLY